MTFLLRDDLQLALCTAQDLSVESISTIVAAAAAAQLPPLSGLLSPSSLSLHPFDN